MTPDLYTVAVTHHPADTLKGFCCMRFTTLIRIEIFLVRSRVKDKRNTEAMQFGGRRNRHSVAFTVYL